MSLMLSGKCLHCSVQVSMLELREVDINWKMLTNARPEKKCDEIFFAQWAWFNNLNTGSKVSYTWEVEEEHQTRGGGSASKLLHPSSTQHTWTVHGGAGKARRSGSRYRHWPGGRESWRSFGEDHKRKFAVVVIFAGLRTLWSGDVLWRLPQVWLWAAWGDWYLSQVLV